MHLRTTYVRRSLRVVMANPRAAERMAADLAMLDCETRVEGATLHVSGSHDALADIERMRTK